MSRRSDVLASSIARATSQVLARGLQDPRVQGLLTVTGVDVTPDLASAVIRVSVLPEERESAALHGLSAAAGHIRREVGELVDTRKLPQFVFRLDRSMKKEAEIIRALEKVRAERDRRAAPDGQQSSDSSHFSPDASPAAPEGTPP